MPESFGVRSSEGRPPAVSVTNQVPHPGRRCAPAPNMSTPNPLAPQGSTLEKHGRGRSTFQIISFIGAVHVFALCGLLWIGCKKDDQQGGGSAGQGDLPPVTGAGTVDGGQPPLPGGTVSNALPGTVTGPGTAPIPGPGVGPVVPPPSSNGVTGVVIPPPELHSNPPSDPVPTPTGQATEHKVEKGDVGTTIASKHGVTVAALKAANPNVNWNKLKLGQVIAIPAPAEKTVATPNTALKDTVKEAPVTDGSSYTVRPGDTGSKIAKKVGVSWKAIRAANGLTTDSLRPGQKLTIPAKGAAVEKKEAGGVPAPAPLPSAAPVVPSATPLPAPLPGR